ncbi:replication protein C [Rhodobacteraceae bacterium RKSG542]|uniref:plasmid replication protein RepC n=1 Tax=Pseudovibrio flavus TaxID=2529854 RepID=UPI0012BC218F|nr:plasmid replication protein RepC [Pseudovibrio flavus]MTI15746.1 replication protein C [Pseudovibrio flavus]
MHSVQVASFRKLTPAMVHSQKLAMANDIVQTTKAEAAITLKRAAPALGIDGTTYHVMDILIGLTQSRDWDADRRPLVAISNEKLADFVCRSQRTVIRAIKRLVELGVLAYRDSPTGRRYIYRNNQSGEIDRGYGFDFSPARQRIAELKEKADRFQAELRAQQEAKRSISRLSRAIKDLANLNQLEGRDASDYLVKLDELMDKTIDIYDRAKALEALHGEFVEWTTRDETQSENAFSKQLACEDDINVTPNIYTTLKEPINSNMRLSSDDDNSNDENASCAVEEAFEKSNNRNSSAISSNASVERPGRSEKIAEADVLSNVSIGLLDVATANVQEVLGVQFDSWRDLQASCEPARLALGVSPRAWKEAVSTIGLKAAGAILVVTLEKALREPDVISRPGGYFRACIDRAVDGRLALHKSLYGLAENV